MTASNDREPVSTPTADGPSITDYLNKDEIKTLRQADDWRALWMFVFNWLVIVAAFVVIAHTDMLLVQLLALLVLAGRQLGIGILLHECSHRSFFSRLEWNNKMGHWLGGIPLLVPMAFYRPYHMQHHSQTGTEFDPDVDNIRQYPVTPKSLLRKLLRDFSGLSGAKILSGLLLYVLPGRAGNTVSMGQRQKDAGQSEALQRQGSAIKDALIFHGVFFSCFWIFGQPLLYLCWWLSFLFFYPFIVRIRQIAEHGAMPALSSGDVRETTRTTLASGWERLFFAPNFVNYHCEHHCLPTVPSYHLPRMHRLLKARGFYTDHPEALVTMGYGQVVKLAASAQTA